MPSAADLVLMFTTGLLGGAHCIGMCGGFVVMYSSEYATGGKGSRPPVAAHLMYNTGRILTYSVVGGFMGYAGSFVEAAGRLKGIQGAALFLAGGFMVLLGLNLLGILGRPDMVDNAGIINTKVFRGAFRKILGLKSPMATFPLGLMLGLVPCGLSYTMEIRAASSGGFVQGFVMMSVFGLGTAPALLGFGFMYTAIAARYRERIYRLAAVLVVLIGVQSLLRGMAFNGWIPPGPLW